MGVPGWEILRRDLEVRVFGSFRPDEREVIDDLIDHLGDRGYDDVGRVDLDITPETAEDYIEISEASGTESIEAQVAIYVMFVGDQDINASVLGEVYHRLHLRQREVGRPATRQNTLVAPQEGVGFGGVVWGDLAAHEVAVGEWETPDELEAKCAGFLLSAGPGT